MDKDAEHLRLLSIFHYIVGGLCVCFASMFIIHILIGLLMVDSPSTFAKGSQAPPAFLGWLFVCMGSCIVTLGWAIGGLLIYGGYCLSRRKHYLLCMIAAGASCLWMPFGTVLGVFTIIVLQRPSVRAMFNQQTIHA
jgi:hypothetical protein